MSSSVSVIIVLFIVNITSIELFIYRVHMNEING